MINLAREPLRGEVEVDETWVGGTQAGWRGSRQLKGRKAALVLVAVEKRGRGTGPKPTHYEQIRGAADLAKPLARKADPNLLGLAETTG